MQPGFRINQSPICLLGQIYNDRHGSDDEAKRKRTHTDQHRSASRLDATYNDAPRLHVDQSHANFLKSFSQRIYFSYRKQFEPLLGSRHGDTITSDCGWGCMIRCAQMLLAQTLLVHMTNSVNASYLNIQISDKCRSRSIVKRRHDSRPRSKTKLDRLLSAWKSRASTYANLHGYYSIVRRLSQRTMSIRHSQVWRECPPL